MKLEDKMKEELKEELQKANDTLDTHNELINYLQKENEELKERINKAIDKIEMEQIRRYLLIPEEEVLKILKGED